MKRTTRSTKLVDGRYELQELIARGGMGEVYRAHDLVRDRPVALKRLCVEGNQRQRTRMFEREFHTLSGLRHPRIIQVYEYGIDGTGAYYTMELLGGRDLRELAPVPYRRACLFLRDIASSLALLHARGLLHRDISPRNVRITDDDRAKLIDFGTISSFGRCTKVMGTAPGIAPETLQGALLDQRTDLYSLGALAYWMVTGRHAFDARDIEHLPQLWSRPPPEPSLLTPKAEGFEPLPPELDVLILSLLDHNPLARPVNAAEVIGRLTAIGQLSDDVEPLSAQSYLHAGRTVGRGRPRARLRKCVKSAMRGRGTLALLEAETGMGCARLLADLAIEAQLLGATPIVVDARSHRGPYGVAREIMKALFTIDPGRARAAVSEQGPLLEHFLEAEPRSSSVASEPKPDPAADPREGRLQLQAALLACF